MIPTDFILATSACLEKFTQLKVVITNNITFYVYGLHKQKLNCDRFFHIHFQIPSLR